MNKRGESRLAGGHRSFLFLATRSALLSFFLVGGGIAAEADLLRPSAVPDPALSTLDKASERKADAIACFVEGLLEEESEGPDQALESFKKTLALDPTYAALAIKLSQEYLRRGETVEAISVLKDAFKACPKDPELPLALSLIYLRHLKKPDLAVQYAQKGLNISPRSFSPYEALWEIQSSQGLDSKAAAVLDRAARSESPDPQFWISLAALRARDAIREGKTPDANSAEKILAAAQKAAERGKSDPLVLSRTGDLQTIAGRPELALASYEAAYNLKASIPNLRDKLASSYLDLGQTDNATRLLEEIVELDPLSVKSYDKLSEIYQREGKTAKAAACARQALIIQPQDLNRHLFLIDMLFRNGDFASAAKALQDARQLFPGVPKLTYFHAIALSQSKQHADAMAAFAEASRLAGNVYPEMLDAKFYFDYGAAAEQAGEKDKAADLFKRSIRLDPGNAAQAYNYLGYMWVEMGQNLDEAEQLIRRALELEPNNGAYMDSLGWLHYQQGKFEDALSELLRAADHLPEQDPLVFDHIADAYQKLGRDAEAVIYWKKALTLDPNVKGVAAKVDAATRPVAHQPK